MQTNLTNNQILARRLVRYSCDIKQGERVWVEAAGEHAADLIQEIIREVYAAGGEPFYNLTHERLGREWLLGATAEQMKRLAKYDAFKMKDMQAFIGVRAPQNANELIDVPLQTKNDYQRYYGKPVNHDIRVKRTKWVVLTYPTPSAAQQANMSSAAYADFYFRVCNMDYEKMSHAMDALVSVLDRSDRVRITGPGTDLSFSIKDIPCEKCDGKRNIPDGEVYTAPVKNSVNGVVTFNTPSVFQGFCFENVRLVFKKGRIIEASANDAARLNKALDTDQGSRFLGEFAFGVNPHITHPTKSILFDEKISGSLHITPGACYDEANNGNKSAIHWDLVLIQTPEYGGGEVYIDDVLIRKDGLFVPSQLQGLNPQAYGINIQL